MNLGIKKISEKTGFTLLEIKVITFLLVIFIAGFVIKSFWTSGRRSAVNYDYSVQDSLFLSIDSPDKGDVTGTSVKDKNVDYKQEVLDFRKPEFNTNRTNTLPAEKSIDINKAGKNNFEKLPGIGPKTADKIIFYRDKIGRFTKLEELLRVKGIGKTKFNKIKKYLYIEK
jgi:competence ComEA-like helix-hairpin-helix protein